MEEKKKIRSLINDIMKGIELAIVFGFTIGFVIGIVKGVSLVHSNGYFQKSLYNLALAPIQLSLNRAILKSIVIPVFLIVIPVSMVKIYGEKGLLLVSSLIILSYLRSFERVTPFNYLLFGLLLYGISYPIGISGELRKKFSFLNKVANVKLALAPIILTIICNGFISYYRFANRYKGPNIILISIDSLRPDHLGCYGYYRKTSPNIDQLAKEGTIFKNAFSQATWTLPSHASIFLSQYVWRHRVGNIEERLSNLFTTLTEILRDRNYATCAFVGGGLISAAFGLNQGFDLYDDGHLANSGLYTMSCYIDKLLNWLESARNRKFFLFIHTFDIHQPYNPPPPYFNLYTKGYLGESWLKTSEGIKIWELDGLKLNSEETNYIMAVYDGGVNYVDDQLGKVFEKLHQLGIDDKTTIILTADHGQGFMEHGRLTHGYKPYIELVRVPLIMKGPGIPRGKICENFAQHIDIVPTILDILAIPQSKEMQGRSLLTLMKNFEIEEYPKTYSAGISDLGFQFSMSLRTKECTYIMNRKEPDELYDRIYDPKEQNNIIKKRPLVAQKLKKELEDFIALTSETKAEVAEKVRIDEELKERLKSLGYLH